MIGIKLIRVRLIVSEGHFIRCCCDKITKKIILKKLGKLVECPELLRCP